MKTINDYKAELKKVNKRIEELEQAIVKLNEMVFDVEMESYSEIVLGRKLP